MARALVGNAGDWRSLMPAVRRMAFILRRRGVVRVTQGGHDVPSDEPRGPIRLRGVNRPEE